MMTLERARQALREIDENIADLLSTACRAADAHGWENPVAIGASAEAHHWMAKRETLVAQVWAMRAADAALAS